MNKWITLTLVSLMGITSTESLAYNQHTYARVTDVEPVYQTQWIKQRHCRTSNADPVAVLGASILGAVIANQISDHDDAATLSGALLGGSVAHASTSDTRCRLVSQPVHTLKGYQVTYRFKGQTYQAFSQQRPGKKIKISHLRHRRFY